MVFRAVIFNRKYAPRGYRAISPGTRLASEINPWSSGDEPSWHRHQQLAFLNNMVGIAQVEFSPEGSTVRIWEWRGGTLPSQNEG
jgi:hypothetical protein